LHHFSVHLVVTLLIAFLIIAVRALGNFGDMTGALTHELREKMFHRLPVYSAETTRGKEAEFIRDRLPRKLPIAVVIFFALYAAAAWWLTR
jgi:hypothetical protein